MRNFILAFNQKWQGNSIPAINMPKASKKQHRGWVFTVNNFTEDDIQNVESLECQAMKAGREKGASGTPHIQGAVYFKEKKSMKAVSELLPRAHLEVMKGDWDQQDYCLKDGDIIREHGTVAQGARNDLVAFRNAILARKTDLELLEEFPSMMARFPRFVDTCRAVAYSSRARKEFPEAIWYHGATGTGKSHRAFEGFSPDTHYVHECCDKGWWDGYNPDLHKVVIFNDFRGETSYNELLTLVDKWPKKVSRRGKCPIPFMAEKIIVTSSLSPEKVYNRRQQEDDIAQLRRRFKIVECILPFGSVEKEVGDM